MLHTPPEPSSPLSASERALLVEIARTALPAGDVFPGADAATVARLERFLATLSPTLLQGYRALLTAVQSSALLRYRKRFANLEPDEQLAVLNAWQRAGIARRLGLRALLAPLKIAHFDNPDFYRTIGCVYEFGSPRAEPEPRFMRERVHDAALLEEDLELECEVVVVGTGAGGAVVAKELAERGHAVVLLEEGGYHRRAELGGRPLDMQRRLYRNAGATFSIGNVGIPIPLGRGVGGTTIINSGTCFRVPGRVLERWQRELGLTELTEDHLAPYFERVEEILGVAPARAEYLGGVARVIARGCDRLGYAHKALQRNAPDCDGKGVCCFGCPTDAKRSTNVSYVPLALARGAELFTNAHVTRILTSGGRAVGVVAQADGRRLTVRAQAVVLACGSLISPVLLAQNGLGLSSGQLGANLSIHPAVAGIGVFDERIAAFDAIPQGYSIEEFHDQGLLFEGASAPLETTMAASPLLGKPLVELAEAFDRTAMFGFMIEDSSRGRVRLVRGRPVITYVMNDRDVAQLKRGVEILARVFFAAGARAVHAPVHGFDRLEGYADLTRLRHASLRASDFDVSAYHPLGTARMGVDPARSVVDSSHRVHDTPGLYVVDGASVPSSLAVNPQLTIMAMATRAAERISDRLDS